MPQYVEAYGQTIEFPDGMTPDAITAAIKQNAMSMPKPKQQDFSMDPMRDMSATDRILSGVGSGMSSAMRAVGAGSLVDKMGLPGTREEAQRLDKPLMATTGGKVGSALGIGAVALPTALIPGANTYAGAALIGAGTGAALTEGGLGERALGAAGGAAGGVVGKGVGDLLGKGANALMQSRAAERAAAQVANSQRDAASATALGAGYVLPPADVKGGLVNEALNGMSGKIKTAQAASWKNQTVTNELARKELGIPADTPLNIQTLNAVRDQAGKAYQAVEGLGTIQPTQAYNDAIDAIIKPYVRAAQSFPGGKTNPVVEEIKALRTGAFDAGDAVAKIRTLRADADAAYGAGNKELGKSLKAGADALEGAIDTHLAALGPSQILNDFRNARQLIAKTYSVQKGLNDVTGDVSAGVLAKQLEKGRPLSGELRTIAEVAQAFPKGMQTLKEAPKATSPLDLAVAAMSGVATGNPAMLGMMSARPAIRSAMLSPLYQRQMLTPNYGPGMLDKSVLPALQSELVRRGLIPGGIAAGALNAN
jgi:hypothetical protein